MLTPTIIFEDPNIIVLSKPAGLLSQGEKKGAPNLVDWLRDYLGRHYVGLVHRLDRNTSGIMVVAKRTKAARRLTESLQTGKLIRTYLACVAGTLEKSAQLRHWLLKDRGKNEVKVVSRGHANAKEAILTLEPITEGTFRELSVTLAQFQLDTGRSHQIRVQSAASGLPLIGDPKYGDASKHLLGRPALHSFRVLFPHPISSENLNFQAPIPEDLCQFMKEAFGFKEDPIAEVDRLLCAQ